MKFATKLSLGCIALLSCALGAAGLLLTGQSFFGSVAAPARPCRPSRKKKNTRWNGSSFRPRTARSLKITFWRPRPSSMPSRPPMRAQTSALFAGRCVFALLRPACGPAAHRTEAGPDERRKRLAADPGGRAVVSAADPAAGPARRAGRYALRLRCERGVRHP